MPIVPGYVYFISEGYFQTVKDPYLMQNKGRHHGRPVYCCKKDRDLDLYWMIPLSSQTDKFRDKFARSFTKYGNCLSLVLGRYGGKDTTFLIQNAFPVIPRYVTDIYKINSNPVPVHTKLQKIIYSKFQQALAIHKKGHEFFFTDIDKDSQIMTEILLSRRRSLNDMIAGAEQRRKTPGITKSTKKEPVR